MTGGMIAMMTVTITVTAAAGLTGEGHPLPITAEDHTDQDHALAPILHVTIEKCTWNAPLEDDDDDDDDNDVDVYFWWHEFRCTSNSVPSICCLKVSCDMFQ